MSARLGGGAFTVSSINHCGWRALLPGVVGLKYLQIIVLYFRSQGIYFDILWNGLSKADVEVDYGSEQIIEIIEFAENI